MIAAVVLAAGSSTRLGRPKQLLRLGDRTVIEHVVDRALASRVDRVIVVIGHVAAEVTAALGDRPVEIVTNPDYRAGQSASLRAAVHAVTREPPHPEPHPPHPEPHPCHPELHPCHPEPHPCHPEPHPCHPEPHPCHPEPHPCHPEPVEGSRHEDVTRAAACRESDRDIVDAIIVLLGDQPGISSRTIERLVDLWRERQPTIGMTLYGGTRSHPVLFSRDVFPELLEIQGDQGAREVIKHHAERVEEIDSGDPVLPADIDTDEDWRALLAHWPDQEANAS